MDRVVLARLPLVRTIKDTMPHIHHEVIDGLTTHIHGDTHGAA